MTRSAASDTLPRTAGPRRATLVLGSLVLLALLGWSGARPYDRATWATVSSEK